MDALVCILRCIVFALRQLMHQAAVLLDLPGLLFIPNSYCCFLGQKSPLSPWPARDHLMPHPCGFNVCVRHPDGAVGVQQHGAWAGAGIGKALSCIFLAVVSLSAAVGFVLYGGRQFTLLDHFPVSPEEGRRRTCVLFVNWTCRLLLSCESAVSVLNLVQDWELLSWFCSCVLVFLLLCLR